jgi:hypothetical protein
MLKAYTYPNDDHLQNRDESHHSRRDAPGGITIDSECAKSSGSSDDRAGEPHGVVERGKLGTLAWIRELDN